MQSVGVVLAVAAALSAPADEPFVVTGVSVVDVERAAVTPGQSILVRDGKIAAVGPAAAPAGVRAIDGTGLFALPSLFDAHVHLNSPDQEARLLVANGVLFARDMGGPTADRLAVRARARRGELSGLDLAVTGTILDGRPPYHPWATACDTPDDGRAAVRTLHRQGVDQVKVYSLLKPAVYRAILAEAKALGLPVVGHVPDAVTLTEAATAGQAGVEHLSRFESLIDELAPAAPGVRTPPGAFAGGAWGRYPALDPVRLATRLKATGADAVAQCPTLVLLHGQARTPPDPRTRAAWDEYTDSPTRTGWTGPIPEQWSDYGRTLRAALPSLGRAVRDLHAAGVPLLVGTDLGNAGVLAGFAVHQEMLLWQQAGVPASAVLRAATVAPARFLRVADRYGAVEPGKAASFVLVRKNPLADVRHAADIAAVVVRGRLLDRPALDALLAAARRDVLARTPTDTEVSLDLSGEPIARGRYSLRYQDWDTGTERFALTRDGDTVRLVAVVRQGGWEVPYVVRGEFAADGTPRRVSRTSLTRLPRTTEYTIDPGRLTVTTRTGDDPPATTAVAFDASDLLLTTAAGGTPVARRLSNLVVGEERAVGAVTVGADGPVRQRLTAKRLADATAGDPAQPHRVYELRPAGGDGPVLRLWVDAAGVTTRTERMVGSEMRSAVRDNAAK